MYVLYYSNLVIYEYIGYGLVLYLATVVGSFKREQRTVS